MFLAVLVKIQSKGFLFTVVSKALSYQILLPDRKSLHGVGTLRMLLLTQMYKSVVVRRIMS